MNPKIWIREFLLNLFHHQTLYWARADLHSWICRSRHWLSRKEGDKRGALFLNVGCGEKGVMAEHWFNVDAFPAKLVRCLVVERIVTKKAPILTLDAFRRASEAIPNLHLDYVGARELLPGPRQFVRAFNLSPRVTLHGAQPNQTVQQLMDEADIF